MSVRQLLTSLTGLLLVAITLAMSIVQIVHSAGVTVSPCDLQGLQVRSSADKKVNNAEVCEAYKFLISRYDPGPRSSKGLSNPKVEGILKLNPDFAVALAKLMKAAPFNFRINSAYRTDNSRSNHYSGCAVDLQYGCAGKCSQNHCNSPGCRWTRANSRQFGIHIRMPYKPEWNHLEPINLNACRSNGPGVGDPAAGPPSGSMPSSSISDAARNFFGGGQPSPTGVSGYPAPYAQQSAQMCALPDGSIVPCSAIANQGGAPAGAAQPTPVGNPPPALPASQQIGQYLQPSDSSQVTASKSSSSDSSTSSKKTSAIEQIEEIADPVLVPGETGVGEILLLSLDGRDVQTLADKQSRLRANATSSDEAVQGNTPLGADQTFISSDIKDSPPQAANAPQQPFGLPAILSAMREVLLIILEYLKPFGRSNADDFDDSSEEWAE